MSHGHHEDDKKEKKKKQREKNRRDWILFQQVSEMLSNVDIGTPSREHKKPEKEGRHGLEAKPWTAKLSTIRNRLDNSKRLSEDRWNRFAGTGDGGGRGR